MQYNEQQIFQHKLSAEIVDGIIGRAFALVEKRKKSIDEKTIFNFIKSEFRKNDLLFDRQACIVAFNENAAFSNSFTICPLENHPRLPPFFLDGHNDFSFATSSKLLPWVTS